MSYRSRALLRLWIGVVLLSTGWGASAVNFTLPLQNDGETLTSEKPNLNSFESAEPLLLDWVKDILLPRLLTDWADVEPETVFDADGILKSALPELRQVPAGFVSVTSAIDVPRSSSERAVFKLTFVPRADRASLDLVIESTWVQPDVAWRTSIGELLALLPTFPAGAQKVLSAEQLDQARQLSALSVYFVRTAGSDATISATPPTQAIPPRLALAALGIAAEVARLDLLAQWSSSNRFPDGALNALRAAVQRQFGTAVHLPLAPNFQFKPEELGNGAYRLKLLKFDPITSQRIRLGLWVGHEGETVPQERVRQMRERGWKSDALEKHFSTIEKNYTAALDGASEHRLTPPAFLTQEESLSRADFIGSMGRVRAPVAFIVEPPPPQPPADPSRDRPLIFNITYQPRLDEFVADFKMTPEDKVIGGASFSSRNLSRGLDDSFSGSFDAGEKRQDAEMSYRTATGRTRRRQSLQAEGGAGWMRDDEQRFGQSPTFARGEKTHVTAKLDFWYWDKSTPKTEETPGDRRWVMLTPTVGWTRESLVADPNVFTRDPSYRGYRAGVSLDAGWRMDRIVTTPGLQASRRSTRLKLETLHTWRQDGADFLATRLSGEAQWQFGPRGERRYFAGVALNAGMASRHTPMGAQWRLGGDAWLRGLEEGELVGREVLAARIEAGLDPLALLAGKAPPTNCNATDPSSTVGKKNPSIAESPFLLVTSIEGGRVSRSDALLPGTVPAKASSFGLGLQIQGAGGGKNPMPFEVNLGYAWSPEGLRERGRMYTSVQFLFPIRNSTQSP